MYSWIVRLILCHPEKWVAVLILAFFGNQYNYYQSQMSPYVPNHYVLAGQHGGSIHIYSGRNRYWVASLVRLKYDTAFPQIVRQSTELKKYKILFSEELALHGFFLRNYLIALCKYKNHY